MLKGGVLNSLNPTRSYGPAYNVRIMWFGGGV